MNSRNGRTNHNFQILHFLAGSCHTVDGAYALLCDLKEDREMALNNARSVALRDDAKKLRAQQKINNNDKAAVLDGLADLAEIEAFAAISARNIEAARDELAFIQLCLDKLEPHRKFAHLSLSQAHEASQHDEWLGELIARAENQLITTGTISPDHLVTMRMHPAFASRIWPKIEQIKAELQSPDRARLTAFRLAQPVAPVLQQLISACSSHSQVISVSNGGS